MGSRSRVVLADDQPLMLAGLRRLLEPELEVVGAVADGLALLAVVEDVLPDLVLAEISLPGLDGIEVTRRLRAVAPATRVLVLTRHGEPSWVWAAFDAGAAGYLTKSSVPEELKVAVHTVLQGRFYLSPAVTQAVVGIFKDGSAGERVDSAPPATPGALTRREIEIVHLVGKGLGNKEIARELGVSVTTVRTHLSRVYEKVGPVSRVELALFAANAGQAA